MVVKYILRLFEESELDYNSAALTTLLKIRHEPSLMEYFFIKGFHSLQSSTKIEDFIDITEFTLTFADKAKNAKTINYPNGINTSTSAVTDGFHHDTVMPDDTNFVAHYKNDANYPNSINTTTVGTDGFHHDTVISDEINFLAQYKDDAKYHNGISATTTAVTDGFQADTVISDDTNFATDKKNDNYFMGDSFYVKANNFFGNGKVVDGDDRNNVPGKK